MTAQRYRPLYKLDAGGMAEVYVAEAESMAGFKKKVAIKRILPGLIKDQRFVRMFLDEARLSLRLNHANVVSVFDIGESENTYFIVMDFVHGTNLKALLEYQAKKGGTMPVALTVWVLNEILKGLAYAHKLTDSETGRPIGIVHRDISPPNILVSWNGEVKLTDFGLAKATTQLESTDPGVVKGKYSYLSPEAARGEEIDHRADVFSTGILAFEMLTGRRLFRGKNDYQTIALVRACDVPSVRSYNPSVPEDLEAVLMRALSKDIKDRYADADDFSDALLQFLFSNRLKIGARDLIEYCRPIREEIEADKRAQEKKAQEERSPGGNNLIINLINEEMLHFRSLGEGEKPAQEGLASEPVVAVGERSGTSVASLRCEQSGCEGREQVRREQAGQQRPRQHRQPRRSRSVAAARCRRVHAGAGQGADDAEQAGAVADAGRADAEAGRRAGADAEAGARQERQDQARQADAHDPPGPADGEAAAAHQQGGQLGVDHRPGAAAARRRGRGLPRVRDVDAAVVSRQAPARRPERVRSSVGDADR
jgi:serine/threonine protein kinase